MIRTEKDKTWAMNVIEDEHIRIRASISMIKNMLSFLQLDQPTNLHYKKINACLQKFYYELKSHFFNEESKGALVDIREDYPEVMKAQLQFNKEPRAFLTTIRDMRKVAMVADLSNAAKYKELSKEFENFCDDIVDHDQREAEAFQSVFYQEIPELD